MTKNPPGGEFCLPSTVGPYYRGFLKARILKKQDFKITKLEKQLGSSISEDNFLKNQNEELRESLQSANQTILRLEEKLKKKDQDNIAYNIAENDFYQKKMASKSNELKELRKKFLEKQIILSKEDHTVLQETPDEMEKEFNRLFFQQNRAPISEITNYETLEEVTVQKMGGLQKPHIILRFKNNPILRKNNWARDFESRLKFCKKLVGKQIATDVWGNFSPKEWFRNIYILDPKST